MSGQISWDSWVAYTDKLRRVDAAAYEEMLKILAEIGFGDIDAVKRYAYALATKYGEASAALAAEMYDLAAELAGATVPAAIPAATATYAETSAAISKVIDTQNPKLIAQETGKLVKTAGVDTTMQNAIRDDAEWAWVPVGDTCAFCITLASRGWQPASKKALKGKHATHIHANCDCTYAIKFDDDGGPRGYNPDAYLGIYSAATGKNSTQKINSIRRRLYAENRDEINAQKRAAYRDRVDRAAENANPD